MVRWDPVFKVFYIPAREEMPDLTEEELEIMEKCAERYYISLDQQRTASTGRLAAGAAVR